MTSSSKFLLAKDQQTYDEYSFIEALSLAPRHSLSLVSKETLGLAPSSEISAPANNAVTTISSTNIAPPRFTTYPKTPVVRTVQTTPKMAPVSKAQSQCLELCYKTTKLGDRISVHMLEYLTLVKELPEGLDALAHGVLDTCEILFALESGLEECDKRIRSFPRPDLLSELEKKFRVTQADFQLLDQILNKFLDYERKGKVGRMRRGWGKIFGDSDFDKMNSTLTRAREMLRTSVLTFQWNMESDKTGSGVGIGYTGLAAALDRLDQRSGLARANTIVGNASQHHVAPVAAPVRGGDSLQPPLPPLPWSERSSSYNNEASLMTTAPSESRQPLSPATRQYTGTSASSVASHERGASGANGVFDRTSALDETLSHAGTAESDSLLDEIAGVEIGPSKVVRLEVDPFTMPRWAPRNTSGSEGGSLKNALMVAIRGKNHKLVEQLLDRGVSPNMGPDSSVLREAIRVHDAESVRLLLLFGADPNETDKDGVSPLLAAVDNSLLGAAITLLKYGADANFSAGPGLESPISASVMANKVGLSHLLLIYGGDPNHFTTEGNTLLISAINKKTPKIFVELLLDYGADPNAKSRDGKTALFNTIEAGRADIVTSLLEHGANPNLPGPKHMLWPASWQPQCLQILLAHGADYKKCPGIMELATSINNIESVRILLKAGVDPNAKKDGVYTALCTSIRDNRPDLFQLLLANGADPNTMASEYPAFKCITHHRLHFLPPLVAAGADLHSPKGILETAVSSNNPEGLIWLLDQGLNPNERSQKGFTALTTAIRDDHVDMVDLLLSRGASPHIRGQDWPVCMAVRNPPVLKRILAVLAEPRAFKGVMEMAVVANQLESVKLLLAAGVSVEDKNGGVCKS